MKSKRKILMITALLITSTAMNAQFNSITPTKSYLKIGSANKYLKVENTEDIEAQTIASNKNQEKEANLTFKYTRERLKLSLPLDTLIVTSNYGMRMHSIDRTYKFHKGIDLSARNNNVYSVMGGVVKKVGRDKKLGIYVYIELGNFISIYGHLNDFYVEKGERIEAGQILGVSGSTGNSTGEHLHFQMEYEGKSIDPAPILAYILEARRLSAIELDELVAAK